MVNLTLNVYHIAQPETLCHRWWPVSMKVCVHVAFGRQRHILTVETPSNVIRNGLVYLLAIVLGNMLMILQVGKSRACKRLASDHWHMHALTAHSGGAHADRQSPSTALKACLHSREKWQSFNSCPVRRRQNGQSEGEASLGHQSSEQSPSSILFSPNSCLLNSDTSSCAFELQYML